MARIKISGRNLQLLSLFERLTGTFPRDCIRNQGHNEIIFVVKGNQMGKVIGKDGITIGRLREAFNRDVRVIQYGEKPELFGINALKPARIQKAMLEEKEGKKILRVVVSSKREKGRAVGKRGRNINRARLLLRRHFGIQDILVTILTEQNQVQNTDKELIEVDDTNNSFNRGVLRQMENLIVENPGRYPGP
ncbi:MAG: NusA-like transcription termination signal-binding factor [Candidatus Heimdallarchaeota archaeon]